MTYKKENVLIARFMGYPEPGGYSLLKMSALYLNGVSLFTYSLGFCYLENDKEVQAKIEGNTKMWEVIKKGGTQGKFGVTWESKDGKGLGTNYLDCYWIKEDI